MSAEKIPATTKRPFGLSFPSRPKSQTTTKPTTISKSCLAAAAFSIDDDDDDNNQVNTAYKPPTKKATALDVKARREIEQAVEENPQIYEYDEIYEEVSSTVQQEKQREENRRMERESNVVRQPKYVVGLLEKSKERQKEYERVKERQIERERAAEGDKYADKEVIVTPAYKAKLAERQADLEREKREEEREAMLNVMHQDNMDAFYRFQFKLRTGEATILEESQKKKPVARQLRHRTDQNDDDDDPNDQMYSRAREKSSRTEEKETEIDEVEETTTEPKRIVSKPVKVRRINDETSQVFDDEQIEMGVGSAAKKRKEKENEKQKEKEKEKEKENEVISAMPIAEEKKRQAKETRIERIRRLCEKRTVGEAFEKAQHAYHEREQRRTFLKDYIERSAE